MKKMNLTMRKYYRKVNEHYQKFHFDIEDGLSTYDLQLISKTMKQKNKSKIYKKQEYFDHLLVA